ncbi:MarR family winged helix-turn-helix transcriptional regulator [Clostridium celatum]|uniref:MarR family winged helix-turn-helix transcriptional regulator n=1 Tax=Clostridium celatum TaxID=36834 RepID=UPI002900C15C|nr:MarR family winged helix-turn-helix transcriptional regulator [Clostridium celatum]MDU2265951.1 MarR family winged helix-turn-helix transcriptional regulator [Clostridium celatum]MDU6296211.1 MarR family winged helix-turn-helix transcriptional regulator [Clostridium celatum]
MNSTNEYFGKYISLIHRQANVFFSKEFNNLEIGSGQYLFMIQLYKHDGINQEKLSDLVNIDKGTTAKAIKKLEEAGLVSRLKDSSDKRVNRIYLTEKAFNIKDQFFDILTKWEQMLTSNLNEDEICQGLNILNKLSKNVFNN